MKKKTENQTTIPLLNLSQTAFYAGRIKNVKKLKIQKTYDFLKQHYKYIIISLEGTPNTSTEHIHLLLGQNETSTKNVRAHIKEVYPDAKGNKCLSVSEVSDVKQCSKYTLKEGNYLYQGFTPEFIRTMSKCSNKKEHLKEKIQENEEKLLSEQITYRNFCINYLKIKVDHGQNISHNHVRSYFNRFKLKSGTMTYEDYYDYYLAD